jgi:DNA polymerase gamma 1
MAKHCAEATLPPMPDAWNTDWPGWTRYNSDGTVDAVDNLGDEDIVVFDVEVLYKISPYPVIASAATQTHWYTWLCPTIFEQPPSEPPKPKPRWDKTLNEGVPASLIPLFEKDGPKIVIGHSVGYDRARIKDEYTLSSTSTRFIDTLSLHCATRGITSVQRPAWIAHIKNRRKKQAELRGISEATIEQFRDDPQFASELEGRYEEFLAAIMAQEQEEDASAAKTWEDVTANNSLKDVAALHCGYKMDKTIRDRFGDATITHASQLLPELHDLIQYCADDVRITHDVYRKVFPLFLDSCPHPASFAGALSMGNAILPVNEEWAQYLKQAEEMYQEMGTKVATSLRLLAEKTRLEGPKPDDPWLSQLDWTPKTARWRETGPDAPPAAVKALADASAVADTANIPEAATDAPAELAKDDVESPPAPPLKVETNTTPTWVERFLVPDLEITTRFKNIDVPLLLRMEFKGYPLAYLRKHGWCLRVPAHVLDPNGGGAKLIAHHGPPVQPDEGEVLLSSWSEQYAFFGLDAQGKPRRLRLAGRGLKTLLEGGLKSPYPNLLEQLPSAKADEGLDDVLQHMPQLVDDLQKLPHPNPWVEQLEALYPTPRKLDASGRPSLTR